MQHYRGFALGGGLSRSPTSIRDLVGGKVDLWYFQSPKNKRRFVFCGELVFLLAIIFESDRNIVSYAPIERNDDEENSTFCPHLCSTNISGQSSNYVTVRTRGKGGVKSQSQLPELDKGILIVTDEWLYQRRVQLDNWIFLCAAINRVRRTPWFHESRALHEKLGTASKTTLDELFMLPDIDRARMLGAVADALQRGTAESETASRPFTSTSLIRLTGD
jgi:hypothetical protein